MKSMKGSEVIFSRNCAFPLMLKFPNISEICAIYRLFKNRKMNKKYPRVSAKHSLDARTPKTSKYSS